MSEGRPTKDSPALYRRHVLDTFLLCHDETSPPLRLLCRRAIRHLKRAGLLRIRAATALQKNPVAAAIDLQKRDRTKARAAHSRGSQRPIPRGFRRPAAAPGNTNATLGHRFEKTEQPRTQNPQEKRGSCSHPFASIRSCSQIFADKSIGAPRFELGTSPTRTVRATRLRHAPTHAPVSHTAPIAVPRGQLSTILMTRSPAGTKIHWLLQPDRGGESLWRPPPRCPAARSRAQSPT